MFIRVIGVLVSVAIILVTLVDGFETILQPRRVTHRFRFARLFYRNAWKIWRRVAMRFSSVKKREVFLSIFGPLSLLGLFASWIASLIFGFGLLHWSIASRTHGANVPTTLETYVYFSGSTFVTLGYGDVTPVGPIARALSVVEAALGFGFLAVIIGYLPVLFQAYSRREVTISLLDARAGSPPNAAQFLTRISHSGSASHIDSFLGEWETWAAELLESHLSFPVLSYFRSQHDNQSWLAALTCILDTCAILIVEGKQINSYRAWLTFGMARHAAVDLTLVLHARPVPAHQDRLSPAKRDQLEQRLRLAGLELNTSAEAHARLDELRRMYEPFLESLAERLLFTLPPVSPDDAITVDNWQRAPGMSRAPGIGMLPSAGADAEHFG